jgi:hypothetical protein
MESADGPVCVRPFNHLPYFGIAMASGTLSLPLSYVYSVAHDNLAHFAMIALAFAAFGTSLWIHLWRQGANLIKVKGHPSAHIPPFTFLGILSMQFLLFASLAAPSWHAFNPQLLPFSN